MKSYLAGFLVFFIFIFALSAQSASDEALMKYKRAFVLGNITEKNTVLAESVKIGGNFAPLYIDSLRFSAENKALLGANKELAALTLSALAGLQNCPPDTAYVPLLWDVFSSYTDDIVRTAVIGVFSKGKYYGLETTNRLNAYVVSQAALERTNRQNSAFEAAIKTLGEIADSSSFSPLFTVLTSQVEDNIFAAAQLSVNSITQDYEKNILHVIEGNYPPQEKQIAFRTSVKNSHLNDKIHGEIAQKTLSMSININEGSETSEAVKSLRQESLEQIRALNWVQAAPAVINYFILAQKEFKNGKIEVTPFIEIIDCLGSMKTADASKVLSGYLAALNSQAELNGLFNEKVVLAVINALGQLGDKSSFDTLLYVSYIQNYPESVADAARDALARLKW